MALLLELIQGLQQTQWELAESIRQIKASNKKEENNDRNHDERESNNKNGTPFVTISNVADLFKQKRERTPKEPKMFARKPPYLPHAAYKGEEEPTISSYGVYYSCCQ
jgi:hypothetical protein